MKKLPNNALESDPVGGWIMIIIFSLVLPIPFAVVASAFIPIFGGAIAGALWLGMCLAFPIWAFRVATKPFE